MVPQQFSAVIGLHHQVIDARNGIGQVWCIRDIRQGLPGSLRIHDVGIARHVVRYADRDDRERVDFIPLQGLQNSGPGILLSDIVGPINRDSAADDFGGTSGMVSMAVRYQATGNTAGKIVAPALDPGEGYPAFQEQGIHAITDAIAVTRAPGCENINLHLKCRPRPLCPFRFGLFSGGGGRDVLRDVLPDVDGQWLLIGLGGYFLVHRFLGFFDAQCF